MKKEDQYIFFKIGVWVYILERNMSEYVISLNFKIDKYNLSVLIKKISNW